MGAHIRRGAISLAVAAIVVLGGGFASAGFSPGTTPADSTVNVTYTVISYRAIELSAATPVAFGAIRQGSVNTLTGPDVLYATTWAGDKIEASLNSDTDFGVKLYLYPGQITEPSGAPCPSGGAVGAAAPTVTLSAAPTPFITAISNCGKAETVVYSTVSGGTPSYSPTLDANPQTWIVAKSYFVLDARNVSNADASAPVSKTVTFTIKAAA